MISDEADGLWRGRGGRGVGRGELGRRGGARILKKAVILKEHRVSDVCNTAYFTAHFHS